MITSRLGAPVAPSEGLEIPPADQVSYASLNKTLNLHSLLSPFATATDYALLGCSVQHLVSRQKNLYNLNMNPLMYSSHLQIHRKAQPKTSQICSYYPNRVGLAGACACSSHQPCEICAKCGHQLCFCAYHRLSLCYKPPSAGLAQSLLFPCLQSRRNYAGRSQDLCCHLKVSRLLYLGCERALLLGLPSKREK